MTSTWTRAPESDQYAGLRHSANARRSPQPTFPTILTFLRFSYIDMGIRARDHTDMKLFDQSHQACLTKHDSPRYMTVAN